MIHSASPHTRPVGFEKWGRMYVLKVNMCEYYSDHYQPGLLLASWINWYHMKFASCLS